MNNIQSNFNWITAIEMVFLKNEKCFPLFKLFIKCLVFF